MKVIKALQGLDEYSRYPEVEIVRSTSANTVIPKLDRILSTHGIPAEIKSDNGPPFQSHSFAQFAQHMGFHHRKITPAWPKANSESERFMRTIQKTLRAAHLENKNWKQETIVQHHIPPLAFPLPSSSLDEK